jgi:hypothetical protein
VPSYNGNPAGSGPSKPPPLLLLPQPPLLILLPLFVRQILSLALPKKVSLQWGARPLLDVGARKTAPATSDKHHTKHASVRMCRAGCCWTSVHARQYLHQQTNILLIEPSMHKEPPACQRCRHSAVLRVQLGRSQLAALNPLRGSRQKKCAAAVITQRTIRHPTFRTTCPCTALPISHAPLPDLHRLHSWPPAALRTPWPWPRSSTDPMAQQTTPPAHTTCVQKALTTTQRSMLFP